MRRNIVLIVLAMCAATMLAQFDPQIGQYMYLPTAYNPAAVGEGDLMKIAGLHRMQFTGIKNAPMSTYIYFGSPFTIGKTRHGAGIRFMNDQFGLYYNQSFYLQYAYRQKLGKGYLNIGLEAGLANVGFKGDSTNLDQLGDDYHVASDPAVPTSNVSGMGFDMSVGIYYNCPTWYAGLSYSHVTNPYVEWRSQNATSEGNKVGVTLRGTMYAHGGYNWKLKHNKDFVMKPSAFLMTDFTEWDLTLSWLTEYKERYRWGLSYRIGANVGIHLGMDIISGLELGYTYELPTSKLLLESYGSHELYLAYGFNILRPKRTNRYRSVRYL